MKTQCIGGAIAMTAIVAVFNAGIELKASGQAPAASAALPRTTDGRPDLSGVWQVMNAAAWNIQDHEAEKEVPAGRGVVEGNEIPYQPWAAVRQRDNFANRATADPEAKCYLPGVPRITYMPYPFQILQTPTNVVLLYEYVHALRNVYLDGSSHPDGHIDWWMGDSRGRWEGETLVVDVVHFNGETWFDRSGNFHSDALHVVERYTMVDRDHLEYEATIDDPKVFTRPWTMKMPLYRRVEKNIQLLEYECYAFDDHEFHVAP
jgi:hypothetical protein